MKHVRVLLLALLCSMYASAVLAEAVDVNSADAQTIAAATKGVGLKKAEAIVAYRKQYGPFKSVDELVNVKGIGAKTIEHNRDNLTVGKLSPKSTKAPTHKPAVH